MDINSHNIGECSVLPCFGRVFHLDLLVTRAREDDRGVATVLGAMLVLLLVIVVLMLALMKSGGGVVITLEEDGRQSKANIKTSSMESTMGPMGGDEAGQAGSGE